MGRRKQKLKQLVTAEAPGSPGAEMLRRVLLGLLTALIVSRPLVLGEDPGLLDPLSDRSGLTLTFLWLIAGLGWAVWRAWNGKPEWQMGIVEIGLLATVGVVFVSAAVVAPYRHPAF